MLLTDEKDLQNQLKSGLSNLYYFYGSDILGVENCVKRVVKAVGGIENVTRLDGQNLDLNHPLIGYQKVTIESISGRSRIMSDVCRI